MDGAVASSRAVRRRRAADATPAVATMLLDASGRICHANGWMADRFDAAALRRDAVPVTDLVPELPLRAGTPGYNTAYVRFWFAGGRWVPFDCVDAGGEVCRIDLSIEECCLADRRGFLLMARRVPTTRRLSSDLAHFMALTRDRAEATLIADIDGAIAYVNPAFEALTGFELDEAVGRTPRLLNADRQSRAFYADLWSALRAGREFRGSLVNRKKNGETFHADETIRPFVDERGQVTYYVATLRDVSARVRSSETLEYLAHHDSHTGLINRHLFLERLRREIAGARRSGTGFALLCLDVDRFKTINDTHGHAAGDAMLLAVANRLKQCVREVDTVARLGGDEFAVILVNAAEPAEVQRVAEKILRTLAEPVAFDGRVLSSTASIGIVLCPRDGLDEQALVRGADLAMYRAKASRGNTWQFTDPGGVSGDHRPVVV